MLESTFTCARAGDVDGLVELLDLGVPVNLTNSRGDTLLMLAVYHGHAAATGLLLERGADTGRINDAGQTPVAAAVFRQREDLVRMLVAAGADPSLGPKNAHVIAEYFGLEAMGRLLRELSPPG
ncbi:ankyrin repeat domain-containing protein [Kytococcus sedentarius]|uniref:ankyrin repeat domain-containing protein n=1 Tax=Kytococcus sedentarius TaxID=1276 RepID=UPI0035BC4F29